jgi:hypothetical protein
VALKNRARAASAAAALTAAALLGSTPAQAAASTCGYNTCFLDARSGAHTGFDRLVFDLSGTSLPTWNAGTTTSNTYVDAAGDLKPLAVTGASYLDIQFTSSGTYNTDGTNSYTSANPLAVGLPSINATQMFENYEGYVSFAVALNSYSSYSIYTLTAPNRVVIDVYH